ncbi:hypothetical protein HPB48_003065 [Haemaphysalis longicornis]|uniref:Multiple inositol polyphosphate phosphatase 1 n=1 Tax=Haemaphysalis longicornis TaxID=44386 RepID=A0A9J6FS56_HAELO|nr:hypothetical protein HPB48_003065 [Haemaphysalis longicornis]
MFPKLLRNKFSLSDYSIQATTRIRTQDTASAFLRALLKEKGDVKLMAKICAFEVAHEGWSPFCHVFDGPDLDLLEYAADLEDYEEDAYGDERNAALACVLFEEMVGKIRAKLQWELTGKRHHHGELKASLYFTHAGPMKRLFAGLGLGKSEPPLRAEDYCGRGRERSWRSSRMAPFSANFALGAVPVQGREFLRPLAAQRTDYKVARMSTLSLPAEGLSDHVRASRCGEV